MVKVYYKCYIWIIIIFWRENVTFELSLEKEKCICLNQSKCTFKIELLLEKSQ